MSARMIVCSPIAPGSEKPSLFSERLSVSPWPESVRDGRVALLGLYSTVEEFTFQLCPADGRDCSIRTSPTPKSVMELMPHHPPTQQSCTTHEIVRQQAVAECVTVVGGAFDPAQAAAMLLAWLDHMLPEGASGAIHTTGPRVVDNDVCLRLTRWLHNERRSVAF